MPDWLSVLWLPFLMCAVLTGIHAYLGLHVVMRGVIFVDIALAQVAALGTIAACLAGHEPGSTLAYLLSLGAALAGAAVLAATRSRRGIVPQEAVIGLVYAAAAAGAILLADRLPHGQEHFKALLAGSIVWVTPQEVLRTALLYAAVGAVHYAFRRPLLEISADPEDAFARGRAVRRWDFLFYATFGVVVTSSVQVAGVLLVFAYLIAPAVTGLLLARTTAGRLLVSWGAGLLASALGIGLSYDRPAGPMVVCALVWVLAVAAAWKWITTKKDETRDPKPGD